MQKITITFIAFLFFSLSLEAQLLLDVCGDGWIQKRLIVGNTSDRNIFIGHNSGMNTLPSTSTTDGHRNIFLGYRAGRDNTTGKQNTFIGDEAGVTNQIGSSNTFIGNSAGLFNTSGGSNTFVGSSAGSSNTTGGDNTFIGHGAGTVNTTGEHNVFIGSSTGFSNTAGTQNVFIGVSTGFSNTTGSSNVFVGRSAGLENETGFFNAFFGRNAGRNNTIGNRNTFLGLAAGLDNSSGSDNIFIGFLTGDANETGQKNTVIGTNANTVSNDLNNVIALGYESKVACNNCATIGGTGSNAVKVGIATTTPLSDLHIKQSTDQLQVGGGIRLENATDTDYWSTTVDDLNDYNFIFNDGVIGWISNSTGNYVNNNPFRSPTGSESRSRSSSKMKTVLPKIQQLQPLTKKITEGTTREAWGFQVEEVAKIFPAITPEKNGQKGIIYDYFGILSIKAIQELSVLVEEQQVAIEDRDANIQNQQTIIENQQANIETLQSDVAELKELVSQLIKNQQASTTQAVIINNARLGQNLPNPFTSSTKIPYTVPTSSKKANILIHSINGQLIKTIAINSFGEGMLELQTTGLSKGQYTYSLEVDGRLVETKQMQLVR